MRGEIFTKGTWRPSSSGGALAVIDPSNRGKFHRITAGNADDIALAEWGFRNYLETKQITTYDRSEPWGWYIKD